MKVFVSSISFMVTFLIVTADKRCPDRSTCSDQESTCCKLSTGGYDCCPLLNAVCCPSGEYCCPSGSTCNEKDGSCTTGGNQMLAFNPTFMRPKNSTLLSEQDRNKNKCPDKEQECTNKETCCKLESGGFGCCPYPGAVCCTDGQHCCPHGSVCDLKEQKCSRKGVKHLARNLLAEMKNWMKEREDTEKFNQGPQKNVKNALSAVICPGKEVQCPDESTCCELKDGQQGCCPLQNAVCCKDQVHCCPEGFACLDTGCKKSARTFFTKPFGI